MSTDLADATEDGAGGEDGTSQTGGTQAQGSGGTDAAGKGGASSGAGGGGAASSGTGGTGSEVGGTGGASAGGNETGGTGGTSSETGGTGGTDPSGGTSGTGGSDCWNPTVQNYCMHFECPISEQTPAWPSEAEIRQHYQDTGVCDDHQVMMVKDLCGGTMIGYNSGRSSESYLIISGTLGAISSSRPMAFGPCNQTEYYSGIELEEWYAMCPLESRCGVCGPADAGDPGYPACRFECDCSTVGPVGQGPEPCTDADSCACYCSQILVDGS